jgi:uncharacterized cupredoxin-like copper-binding protein
LKWIAEISYNINPPYQEEISMDKQLYKRGTVLFSTLLLAAVLAACGGPASVDVTMVDYEMQLSTDNVKAGEVTFHVHNDSEITVHEFVVVKTDTMAADIPVGEDLLVDESLFTPVDEIEDIAAGAGGDLTVTLEPGHYILLCNIPGHYQLGMHIDFTVSP